eukprot:CAMPEP_0202691546 /NCGR_PEP_ID=MMETSP1385-20130828/6236_1 /ASSEMBLY_ACC=CAM_ASM_000861 /TAXON_ID=933848 /ORGANISM="Elphidium margaritaceum" /LENGTH=362 /DNA_ID=CAMNT_0049346973 /DNA_START=39 /DNA_END=1127 /DNA_ORIENTATION=+
MGTVLSLTPKCNCTRTCNLPQDVDGKGIGGMRLHALDDTDLLADAANSSDPVEETGSFSPNSIQHAMYSLLGSSQHTQVVHEDIEEEQEEMEEEARDGFIVDAYPTHAQQQPGPHAQGTITSETSDTVYVAYPVPAFDINLTSSETAVDPVNERLIAISTAETIAEIENLVQLEYDTSNEVVKADQDRDTLQEEEDDDLDESSGDDDNLVISSSSNSDIDSENDQRSPSTTQSTTLSTTQSTLSYATTLSTQRRASLHVFHEQTSHEWDPQSMHMLQTEMTQELRGLAEQHVYSPRQKSAPWQGSSAFTNDAARNRANSARSLFRSSSEKEWDDDDIERQKDEMRKQIIHLARQTIDVVESD